MQQQQLHPDAAKPAVDAEMILIDECVEDEVDVNKQSYTDNAGFQSYTLCKNKRTKNSCPLPTHQELLNNTNYNAMSTLPKCPPEIVIPVWKFSNHCKRNPAVQSIPKQVWK